MKPQLKPGCLAEVVGTTISKCGQSNRGRIVTVLRRPTAEDGRLYVHLSEDSWTVEAPGLLLISIADRVVGRANFHVYNACVLRPISDPDVDLGETTEKTLELVE